MPIEPPICCIVLTIADATPASLRLDAERRRRHRRAEHEAQAGADDHDPRQDVRRRTTCPRRSPSASAGRPTAISMPPPISGRGPILGSSFVDALTALMTIASVIGRNARPDWIGENCERLLQVVRQEQEHARTCRRPTAASRGTPRRGRGRARRAAAAAGWRCAAGSRRRRRAAARRDEHADRDGVASSCASRRSRGRRRSRTGRSWRSARRGCRCARRCSGTSLCSSDIAASAAGTANARFTNRHQRQLRYSVSTPPRIRPIAAPPTATAPNDAERLAALLGIGERRRQQRQRGRCEQRAEDALQRAGRDEHLEALREAAERARDGEAAEADDERALAPEEVADAPAEQQQAAERQRVRGDDPLALVVGERRAPPAPTAARCSRRSRRARP